MAKKKVKPLESVISVTILSILAFIIVAIISMQFGAAPHGSAAQGPDGYQALEIEKYGPANLYEKINGKAPLYVDAGFQQLTAQRFVNSENPSLWFENYVYDMGENKNAFSVYSTQKRTGSQPLSDIDASQAYKTSNGLYFVKGKFYVEMIASAQSPQLLDAAKHVAKQMQADEEKTDTGETQLSETDLLQTDNMIPDSIQLYRNQAFGFGGFGDLYAAKYQIGDQTVTAFINECQSPEKAKQMAKNYRDFIIQNGGQIQPPTNSRLQKCLLDFYGMYEIVTSAQNFVVGIHEAPNPQAAEKLTLEIIKKLEK